jgi:radical SAM superfamily enzyme YgiQ (UPF0313 family)
MDYGTWYERTRGELTRAGLWLRGGELNTLPAAEAALRDARVLFVRLSTYENTGYSFTHQLLYQLAADVPGVFPDLAYLPPQQDAAILERDGVPWLLGTQSKRGPADFDLIGFSNSIVQELVNLPHFLARSGLPLGKRERLERPDVPLLLLGGANALYSSALWVDDPLIDGVFVGESEVAIRRILEIVRDGKRAGRAKRAVLDQLAEVDGFIEPDRPRRTRKAFVPDLNRSAALERGPVYFLADALGSAHLQISEGCPCFCSFCAESWDRKPYRERRAPTLSSVARAMKANMGLDSIELYSFNFNMHSDLYRVIWDLVPEFRDVGLKSQRFDLFAHDPGMVEFQHVIGKTNLTCGLEGISPRLRRYLHKNLEDDQLHGSLDAIFASRARGLKVFLIATGLEEEEDFLALQDLVEHMAAIREQRRANTRVTFSITPLVRFPWTPLEFEDAPPRERYAPILERVASIARGSGFEFRESAELDEYWVSQALVRADDPRIHAALLDAVQRTGFVFQREITPRFRTAFERALVERGLDERALFAGFDLETSARKPWVNVSTGVHRSFLWKEFERARAWTEIDYCLGRSWTRAKCFRCGGCPTTQHVVDIVRARQDRPFAISAFAERVRASRAAESSIGLLVDVGPAGVGLPRKAVAVALARALMLAEDELVPLYRGFESSHWAGPAREDDCTWIGGEDVLTLRFDGAARAILESLAAQPARVDAALGDWGRLLGLAPGTWQPARLTLESPFPARLDRWLQERTLGATLRKDAAGRSSWDFGPKARKRDVLRAARLEKLEQGVRMELEPGRRFDLDDFVRHAFALPQKSAWIHVRTRAHGSAHD